MARQMTSLAPRHTLFFQTQMAPQGLRSLIPHAGSLDMSIQAGLGPDVIPLSRLDHAAVVCLVGIGKPEVRRRGGGGGVRCWDVCALPAHRPGGSLARQPAATAHPHSQSTATALYADGGAPPAAAGRGARGGLRRLRGPPHV